MILTPLLSKVDPNRFVFEIPSAETINHIVVFLTGVTPFPEGLGATVHFLWPGKQEWQLLGMSVVVQVPPIPIVSHTHRSSRLSNTKPSAIFRLRGTAVPSQASAFSSTNAPTSHVTATLGILVEDLSSVEAQVAALHPVADATNANASPQSGTLALRNNQPQQLPDPVQLAIKVGRHLFNFLSSFSPGPNQAHGGLISADELGQALERWLRTFEAKLKNGGLGWLEAQD
jgi:hypothetical protein